MHWISPCPLMMGVAPCLPPPTGYLFFQKFPELAYTTLPNPGKCMAFKKRKRQLLEIGLGVPFLVKK